MGLNNINSKSTWGQAASDINTNFTTIDSDLKKVKNATTRNKGYFSSIDELKAAFSTANVGDIAYVGSAYPYQTWAWDGSAWKKKNDAGGEESVNLGDYYTKVETDEKFTEADAKLSELGSKVYGVSDMYQSVGYISQNNTWAIDGTSVFIPCNGRKLLNIGTADNYCIYSFVKNDSCIAGQAIDYAAGAERYTLQSNKSDTKAIPSDAEYLVVSHTVNGVNWLPSKVDIDGVDYAKEIRDFMRDIVLNIESIETNVASITPVSDNEEFNSCIKELYIPDIDIESIKQIRLYNGYSGRYGITLYDGENEILAQMLDNNKEGLKENNNAYVVMMPLDSVIEAGNVKDYLMQHIKLNDVIKNVNLLPTIKSYILYKENLFKIEHINSTMTIERGSININKSETNIIVDIPPSTRIHTGGVGFYLSGEESKQFIIGLHEILYAPIPTETKGPEDVVEPIIGNFSMMYSYTNIIILAINGNCGNINGGILFPNYINHSFLNLSYKYKYVKDNIDKSESCDLYISTNDVWKANPLGPETKGLLLYCKNKNYVNIIAGEINSVIYAFLKNKIAITEGNTPNYCDGQGRKVLTKGRAISVQVPSDAEYIYISDIIEGNIWLPESITFDDDEYNFAKSLYYNIQNQYLSVKEIIGDVKGINPIPGYIHSSNTWAKGNYGCFITIGNVETIEITANGSYPTIYGILKDNVIQYSVEPNYAEGCTRGTLTGSDSVVLSVPTDAKYLWVSYEVSGNSWFPSRIEFDGVDILKNRIDTLTEEVNELDKRIEAVEDKESNSLGYYFNDLRLSPNLSALNVRKPLIYTADTKKESNHLVNAVIYPNGVIIGARVGGSIVKIDLEGNETTLMTINGASDWRCLWMDKDLNVFASPHASISSMSVADRGLYKLDYGSDTFTKVLSLYNVNSSIPSETEDNDDTIWTMCQDNEGNLYAGVYSHTKHYNPAIYKSIDGGDTWVYHYNFIDSGLAPAGHHIHTIIYNQYDNALYCIVGEINTVYRSTDGAATWISLNAPCEYDKGSAMYATPTGILIGSDGAYNCAIAKLYPNGEVKTKGVASANTIFGFRQSDITRRIYAICKIDSSVGVESYFPPIGAINDESVIQEWKNSVSDVVYQRWLKYKTLTETLYKDDAIKPQHFMIMASDDEGETWYVVYREFVGAYGASGLWTAGYFRNGECLVGRIIRKQSGSWEVANPLVIFDGTYKYTSDGISVEGSSLIKTNNSSTVVQK